MHIIGFDVHKHFLWIKINKEAGLLKDLYIATCYFPPKDSPSFDRGEDQDFIFSELATQVSKFQDKGYVILVGDFNAHTNNQQAIVFEENIGFEGKDIDQGPFQET